jgi:ribosome-associated protein
VNDEADKPSRTRKKREAEAAQRLGEELLTLRDAQLEALALTPELHEAVLAARAMRSHGARRRQLQYIGSLMRQIDAEALRQRLASATQQAHDEARRFKQVELWRDELMAGDLGRRQWLIDTYPRIDPTELMQFIQAAAPDLSSDQRRKAGRALFRYLRQAVEGTI